MKFLMYPMFRLRFFSTGLALMAGMAAQAQEPVPAFRHHVIEASLPVYHNSQGWPVGDYGASGLADFDGDGDLDFTIGRHDALGPSMIYWFENRGIADWARHVAGHDTPTDVGGDILDVDEDGKPDIVHGGVWFRNPSHPRESEFDRLVFDQAGGGMHDVVAADVNGDGTKDVVTMSDRGGVFWYQMPGFKKHRIADGIHGGLAPHGVDDLDGDGDLDVFRGTVWLENRDHAGEEWAEHSVPLEQSRPSDQPLRSFRSWIADLDRDGDNDVVVTDCDWMTKARLRWLENVDGRGTKWTEHAVGGGTDLHSLVVADFDLDGDLDLFTCDAEEGATQFQWRLFLNSDGKAGSFAEHVILDDRIGGHETRVGDLDGDGDLDLISKPWTPSRDNSLGGKMHVDVLENRLRSSAP